MGLLCLTIDSSHQSKLTILLFNVRLIDANSIGPKEPIGDSQPQATQKIDQILCRVKDLATHGDGLGLLRIAPNIREGFVLWVIIQGHNLQATGDWAVAGPLVQFKNPDTGLLVSNGVSSHGIRSTRAGSMSKSKSSSSIISIRLHDWSSYFLASQDVLPGVSQS